MPDNNTADAAPKPTTDFGPFQDAADDARVAPSDVIAGVVSVIWLALVGGFFLLADSSAGTGGIGFVMTLIAIFLPIALIWVMALTARTAAAMRAETRRLQAAVDAMRHSYVAQTQAANTRQGPERAVEPAMKEHEGAKVTFASRRDTTADSPSNAPKPALVAAAMAESLTATTEQPSLALGTPAEDLRAPVSVADFVSALNFPDNPDDREGFRALRAALEDRGIAKLIRAAQDVLTLLSQDGIYMDDLRPDRARPEIWRRFAQGERGRTIAPLGGVRDRSSLALTAGRMRQDTIFRDAAHHFLRQFDRTFTEFESKATDPEIAALADTRTARAFMLLGRVTGIFD